MRGASKNVASSKHELASETKTSGSEETSDLGIWDTTEALQMPELSPSSNPPSYGVAPLSKPPAAVAGPSVPPPGGATFVGLTPVPHQPVQAASVGPARPSAPASAHPASAHPGSASTIPPSAPAARPKSSEARTSTPPRGVLAPGEQFGVFHVGPCFGEGGMARIYQAEHAGLRRQVALKVLLDASTRAPEGRERFLREARIAAAIKHPNVVNIFDVGVHEDTAFLVMELLTGTDLEQLIEERGALDEGTIIDIMIPVLAGLAAVHDAGVVHRDLKPGNVFLAQGRYDEVDPKLLDFGISKAAGPEQLRLTANGMLIGTPFYMSPEGLRGEEMTPASDQYSLGVVMYECATGINPFHASTFAEIFKLIGAGQYPPPSSTRPQISKRLERIITRAMSLDPAQRYKDLREMGRDLLVLAGQRTRITWSLSFGEVDRPRASSTSTWTVPERSAPPPPADDNEVILLRPKRRLLMPVLWTAFGAAILLLGLASAGVFSRQVQPEGRLPAQGVVAPAGNRSASSETAAAAAAPTPGPAGETPALVVPRVQDAVAVATPRPAHRASWPQRRSASAAQAATKTDDNNPDWAIAPATPAPARPAGQARTQAGVGANGAPIFD